jgi:hypothetical protein
LVKEKAPLERGFFTTGFQGQAPQAGALRPAAEIP